MFHYKFIYLFIFLLLVNCNVKKASVTHGVSSLEFKSNNIIINKSNRNDAKDILGPPSIKSNFNVALTGTPVENDINEFFNIIDLSIPGIWGDLRRSGGGPCHR